MATRDVFTVIANPVRRRILDILRDGPCSAGTIADAFTQNRPAISEHLQALRLAGLVSERTQGRRRIYRLQPEALAPIRTWLHPFERYWHVRLQSLNDSLAEVPPMIEPGVIRLDRYIPHPPARVWAALTEPDWLAKWWARGDIRPLVGHRFSLDMGPWGQQPCEVVAVEAGKLIAYSFAPGTLDTTVTWRIEPEGSGTRLWLEHRGFDLDSPIGGMAFEGMSKGWPAVIDRLAALSP